MAASNQLKNQHLMWRAGFGPMAEDINQLPHVSHKSLFKEILKASSKTPDYIDVADDSVKGLMIGIGDVVRNQKNQLTEEQKKSLRKQSQQDIKSLNLAWLRQMINSDAQLREKMALFWHGHFASRNLNIFYQQLLLDVIRKNALGNFSDLLHQVSKSAAMINFLNNNQNKKDHPNENFAREVMELFTLGRGHYSETDVKEAARAFTGWGSDLRGEFTFRGNQHDTGDKTFLGKTGRFDGDDILDILLDQKQTAYFISGKIYRFFVNEKVDESKVRWLAERFYASRYDVKKLMEDIFTSEWFYSDENIGKRVKSPIELIVGIRRMLPMELENEDAQLLIQRLLGQLLFYPPNVAGWPGGLSWIDSSTLMLRLRIPQVLYRSDELQMKPKDDDDQMMGMKEHEDPGFMKRRAGMSMGKMIRVNINWEEYTKNFTDIESSELAGKLESVLLQSPLNLQEGRLNTYLDFSSKDSLIKTTTIQMMSTPEYQLC
ncbi:MAG: DUF1800 domain-containing protein [Bacteroidetes bacterium]|nr:MAG: DUF1800 domain-containing protein [Bacteroidota bacterium]